MVGDERIELPTNCADCGRLTCRGDPPSPQKKSLCQDVLGTFFAVAHPVPTLSIRRQRTGGSRPRHHRRQALRHHRRWGRCPRCRCTHRRTPRARRWRGWRLRSADQSSNSCVQSRSENVDRQHFSYNFFYFFSEKRC